MRDEVVLIVDTNSNYSDVWNPCFTRLDKYASKIKKYVFTDTEKDVPKNYTPIIYDNSASYRNQLLSCLKQIKENPWSKLEDKFNINDNLRECRLSVLSQS